MFSTHFFSSILLPVALGFVILGMGLSLTKKDFTNIFLRPKAVIIGLIAQMLILPVLAFGIASAFNVPVQLKVGLMLLAICPGGATSNLLNYLLNGNLALCVSLTTINSFLTQFTIPLLLNFSLWYFMDSSADVHLPFLEMLSHIFLITLLPVTIGLMIRARYPIFAEKARRPMKMAMPAIMAIALVGVLLEKNENAIALSSVHYLTVLPMTLLLNIGSLLGGYYFARITGLSKKTQMTIAIEVGLHNTLMAIYIATGILHDTTMAIPAAMYALFTFFTTALFGIIVSGQKISIRSLVTGIKDIRHKK